MKLSGDLGPGEIVFVTDKGFKTLVPPGSTMQICSFPWIYYGYPASSYEGINVEASRYRCGAALAKRDKVEIDCVAGIPDSGTAQPHIAGVSVSKMPIHGRSRQGPSELVS